MVQDGFLTSSCVDILLSPPCMAIDFVWRYQKINGQGYRSIAVALMEDRIGTTYGELDKGALAGYERNGNVLYFPAAFAPGDPATRISMVHECTHAIQDEMYPGHMDIQHAEGAAYLAGCLYNLYAPPHLQFPLTGMKTNLWRIVYTQAYNFANSRTKIVNSSIITAITDALWADDNFKAEVQRNGNTLIMNGIDPSTYQPGQ